MIDIETVFDFIEKYSTLLPLFIFFVKKSTRPVWAVLLVIYLLLYLFVMAVFDPFIYDKPINILTYIIVSVITFNSFCFVIECIINAKKFRVLNRVILFVTNLFFIQNAIWGEGTSYFNSISSAVANFILVCYCLYYFKLQFDDRKIVFITDVASFWTVAGIFTYGAGNFFLFALYATLTKENAEFAYYSWYINDVFVLLMNLFFSKSLYCNWKR